MNWLNVINYIDNVTLYLVLLCYTCLSVFVLQHMHFNYGTTNFIHQAAEEKREQNK